MQAFRPKRKLFICLSRSRTAWWRAFMEDTNLNLWGLIVVPVGLVICFGLALLVWLRDELRAGSEEKQEKPR
jgi:hypothetical protein